MKKLISFILIAILALSFGSSAFAQTLDSSSWGIKFNLSDNWKPLYDNPEVIQYSHKYDSDERIIIAHLEGTYSVTTREAESVFNEDFSKSYSNVTLSQDLSEANNGAYIRITEKYKNFRYESYNGIEYYRCEKMYLAQATGYYDQYFYDTVFYTIQNSKVYMLGYHCMSDKAPHFADVTAMLNSMTYPIGIGSVVGYALTTDIVATINSHQIPSFNVDGYTYIVAEDLRYYGFNVTYDEATRSLSVSRDFSQTRVSKNYVKPYVAPSQVGEKEYALLYTDIKTYLDGVYTPSYNINGQTIIRFDSLFGYGVGSYDNSRRETFLRMSGIN